MSGWFNFTGNRCTVQQEEEEKRKTMMFQLALKNVDERRSAILSKTPDSRVSVWKTENKISIVAFDKTGNHMITEENYHIY